MTAPTIGVTMITMRPVDDRARRRRACGAVAGLTAALMVVVIGAGATPARSEPQLEGSPAEQILFLETAAATVELADAAIAGQTARAHALSARALDLQAQLPTVAINCVHLAPLVIGAALAHGDGDTAVRAARLALRCSQGPPVPYPPLPPLDWPAANDEAHRQLADTLRSAGRLHAALRADARAIEITEGREAGPFAASAARCAYTRWAATLLVSPTPDPVDCQWRAAFEPDGAARYQAWKTLAAVLSLRGRPAASRAARWQAVELALTDPEVPLDGLPDDLAWAAERAQADERHAEALALVEDAEAVAAALADGELDPGARADWAVRRAEVLMAAKQPAAARAAVMAIDLERLPPEARIQFALARAGIRRRAGDDGAVIDFEHAAQTLATVSAPHLRLAWQFSVVATGLALDQTARSRALALEGLALLELGGAVSIGWTARMINAFAAQADGRATAAVFHAKLALEKLHAARDAGATDDVDPVWLQQYRTLATMLVEGRGRVSEARAVAALVSALPGALRVRGADALDGARVPLSDAERGWADRYRQAAEALRAAAGDPEAPARFVARLEALEAEMVAATVIDPTDAAPPAVRSGEAMVQLIAHDQTPLVIVTTTAGRQVVELEASAAVINTRAAELYEALHAHGEWAPASEALYDAVIGPIAPVLRAADADTLIWRPDGGLRHVPLAALRDRSTGRFVLQDFTVVRAAPAVARPRRALDRVAAFGVTASAPGLAALPAVRIELHMVAGEGGAGALPGTVALDDDFDAAALDAALAPGGPPVVHVASHFVFRPGEEAFLLLGGGARATLGALARRGFGGVELLVLSACQTAVGTFAEGQPVDGFAALAIERGARAVVASLWPVVDDGTARLMARFYRALADGHPAAAALRRAQLMMIARDEAGRGASRWLELSGTPTAWTGTHPSVWAAFVMTGDTGTGMPSE